MLYWTSRNHSWGCYCFAHMYWYISQKRICMPMYIYHAYSKKWLLSNHIPLIFYQSILESYQAFLHCHQPDTKKKQLYTKTAEPCVFCCVMYQAPFIWIANENTSDIDENWEKGINPQPPVCLSTWMLPHCMWKNTQKSGYLTASLPLKIG